MGTHLLTYFFKTEVCNSYRIKDNISYLEIRIKIQLECGESTLTHPTVLHQIIYFELYSQQYHVKFTLIYAQTTILYYSVH